MNIAALWTGLCKATPKQGFIRSVAVLVSGSVLGQAIVILGSPLLTRLYSPEEFGIFASFGGILVVIGTLSALGYHVAIPIPEDDREADQLVVVATWLCCTVAVVVLGFMFLSDVQRTISAALGGTFLDYVWLLPLALLLSGFYDVSRLWNIRAKQFPILSVVEVSQRLTTLAVQVVLGVCGFAAGGLIAGTLGGLGVSLCALLLWNFRSIRKPRFGSVPISQVMFLIKKYRQFALYRCPSGLVFWGGRCAPLLLLPWLFGPVVTGLYALTDRVLQTPMAFVVTHIQSVFLASCTELKASGKLADAALSLLRTQVWLGLPAFAIFSIVAPDIFALVFGEAWRSSGHYAQLLMPYMFLTFISLPLNALPIAFDKQQGELFFQAGMAVARCAALLVGSALGGVELTMALLSMVGAAGWLLYLLWTMSLVNHRPGRVLQDLAREALFSVPFILPLGLAKMLMDTGGSGWFIAIATLCWLASLAVVAVRAMPALGVSNISLAGSVTPSS